MRNGLPENLGEAEAIVRRMAGTKITDTIAQGRPLAAQVVALAMIQAAMLDDLRGVPVEDQPVDSVGEDDATGPENAALGSREPPYDQEKDRAGGDGVEEGPTGELPDMRPQGSPDPPPCD